MCDEAVERITLNVIHKLGRRCNDKNNGMMISQSLHMIKEVISVSHTGGDHTDHIEDTTGIQSKL